MLYEYHCVTSSEAKSAAYEALWRAAKTFNEDAEASFSTYACTCIKNALFDVFRRMKDISENEIPLEDCTGVCTYDTLDEEHEESTEVQEAVDEALKKLSGKRLKIATLWLESSMSVTALAKEVPCSQSYASQTIAEIRALLRKELINAGCARYSD